MLAQMTVLRYWKSEHSEDTCEDAANGDSAQGLFVVADGAGTTLFADAWAHFLVQYFLHIPLLGNDPFEAEWWMRMAQEQFKKQTPAMMDMAWNAQQKMQNQGSYATLATLRIFSHEAEHAQAELLAFGDTCVFLSQPANEHITSFPIQQVEDFERAPICLPSKIGTFNRYFHQSRITTIDLFPDDMVVLATDAVAKWIISSGAGRYTNQKAALQAVTEQTPATWADFIQTCRTSGEMIDDDCTALILHPDTTTGCPLGTTTNHNQSVKEQRKLDLIQALNEENRERIAIYFGDGQDMHNEGVDIAPDTLLLARRVADAQREVLAMLRQEANSQDVVARMTPVWQKHAHLLAAEPCAAPLRKTLAHLGIPLELREEKTIIKPASQHPEEHPDTFYTQVFDGQAIQQMLQADKQAEGEE